MTRAFLPFQRWYSGDGLNDLSASDMNRLMEIVEKINRTSIEGYDKRDTLAGVHFRKHPTYEARITQAIAAAGAAFYQVQQIDYAACTLRGQRWDLEGAPFGDVVTIHFPPHLHRDSYDGRTIAYPLVGNITYVWRTLYERSAQRIVTLDDGTTIVDQQNERITPPYVTAAESVNTIASAILVANVSTSEAGTRLTDVSGYRAWAQSRVLFEI